MTLVIKRDRSLASMALDSAILFPAIGEAFRKLDPGS